MVAIIAAAAQTSVNRIVTIFNIGLCEWRYSHRRWALSPLYFVHLPSQCGMASARMQSMQPNTNG